MHVLITILLNAFWLFLSFFCDPFFFSCYLPLCVMTFFSVIVGFLSLFFVYVL